jgi:hypothetical protein
MGSNLRAARDPRKPANGVLMRGFMPHTCGKTEIRGPVS